MRISVLLSTLATLFFALPACAQMATFDKQVYHLDYAAENSKLAINEYVLEGYTVDNYNQLFALHIYRAQTITPVQLAANLGNAIKQKNAAANYKIIKNESTGEVLIDFLTGEPGTSSLSEFDIFKLKQDPTTGDIIAIQYVLRDRDTPANSKFAEAFKTNRTHWIDEMAKQPYPTFHQSKTK